MLGTKMISYLIESATSNNVHSVNVVNRLEDLAERNRVVGVLRGHKLW